MPDPIIIVRPKDTPTGTHGICVSIDESLLVRTGDTADSLMKQITSSLKVTVDGKMTAFDPLSYNRISSLYFGENGTTWSGPTNACAYASLAAGLHIGNIEIIDTSGQKFSYLWAFRTEDVEPSIRGTIAPPTLASLPTLSPTLNNTATPIARTITILESNPRPAFIGQIYLSDYAGFKGYICVHINGGALWEPGNEAVQVHDTVRDNTQIEVDGEITLKRGIQDSLEASLFLLPDASEEEMRAAIQVPEICVATEHLELGLHKVTLTTLSVSGVKHSYTWQFRLETPTPIP